MLSSETPSSFGELARNDPALVVEAGDQECLAFGHEQCVFISFAAYCCTIMTNRADISADNPRIGVDRPDGRGRTGLDQVGRDLARNPDVVIREVEVTSDGWHVLRRTTFDYRRRDGQWETQRRETYDRGNGATILPYDADRRTVLPHPPIPVSATTSTITRTRC